MFADTTLVTNIKGYTLNSQREMVQFTALQFSDDIIDRLYTDTDPLPEGADIVTIDGDGHTLLPGLIDAHGHILSYGLSLLRVNLTGTSSEQEAVQRIIDFQRDNGKLDWIQGRGWNQVLWESNEFPTSATLDEYLGSTPIWLRRVDGHAGWANSAAMDLAGINLLTPDPAGGQIIRDREGKPTGVFVDNAMGLITAKIPSLTLEEQKFALNKAMLSLAKQGLTSVHDAGVSSTTVEAYKQLQSKSPLPIRVNIMLSAVDPNFEQQLAKGHFLSDDGILAINSVKIAADGALGSRGAALIDEYSDMPDHTGLLLHSAERLNYYMETAMRAGFQVNTHAIGDHANKIVMDHYQRLIQSTNSKAMRHRIEHAQVLRFEDILRFSELGVIASMQATHATSDKNMAEDRLGSIRIQGAYAWRKLLQANAVIANGSDFPVESPNPFFGLHAAITRQDHNNEPPGGWMPEEKMTVLEAFASFTIDAAYAGHQETSIGTLEAGKKADFILIDQDIMTIDPSMIWQTTVLQTWVNGVKIE